MSTYQIKGGRQMGENPYNEITSTIENEAVKGITNTIKKVTISSEESNDSVVEEKVESKFKMAGTNLPEKTGFWTKLKNVLFYEVKIELTPYQQKIEREINDFLHQEITWKSLKEAALSEVPITFRGKRIF